MRSATFISFASPVILATLLACSSNAQQPDSSISAIAVTPCAVGTSSSQQLSAQATLADGSKEDITQTASWTSSNTSTATVDSTGNVVGVALGTVTITASMAGKSGTSGCVVGP